MKKNYICKSIVALLFLFLSNTAINGQVRGFDEFLMNPEDFDQIGTTNPNAGPEIADFSFASSSTFNIALANQVLWNLARQQLRTAWFNKQKNLIKEHIEDKFNENYPTYEAAQEKLFLNSEIKNVIRNVVEPRTRYQNLRSQGFGTQRQQLQDLKLLDIRANELNAGNINNPQYGYIKVDDTYLKDMTSINQIEQFRGPIIPLFEENTANTHENNYIYLKLNNLGDGIHQEALDLKKGYYNGFEDWTKLNYMQFLIQYEEIKRLTSVPYYYPNLLNLMNQFKDTDQATSQMIETYARSNRDGGHSIFSHAYFQQLLYMANISGGNQYVDYSDMYASVQEDWEQQKRQALGNLVDNTDTSTFDILNLIGRLGIDDNNHKAWLHAHSSEADDIINFLNASEINGVMNAEARDLIMDFLSVTDEILNAKFLRFKELENLIKNDPWAVIRDCIQQNGLDIANYQQLYDHTLPTSCINRLDALGEGFEDQPLHTGNAAVANVDYYGVEITINPDLNFDGIPDTDAEVYAGYRAKFTDLASGSEDDFQFSCNIPGNDTNRAGVSWRFTPYYPTDATIWNSTNPLTAILKIDANSDVFLGSLISDDGAIMISAFTTEYWIGSTVSTFITESQPFSGNRQWGHLTNQNGNLELYARAVDIARVSNVVRYFTPGTDECKSDTYYNIGETTWSNLQEEIKDWVNGFNGQASVIPKTAVRFDRDKLKELLESNESIDQINCN